MKIFIVAAAAWAAGALLGYFVARLAYKHLRKRLRTLRQERKPPKKKMGTMDRILVLEAVFLVAYTVADLVVFWHTGSEPATLTGCVFGVCGLENGVMGWIKTNKDKAAEDAGTSGSGTQPPPERCVKCIVTCDGKNAPYCISKALIAARNGDWENGLFFCGAAGGEVNTLSTVPEQMAQIMDEWRAAQ